MSYLRRILQPGETLRYVGRLHWIVYLPGLVLFAIAVTLAAVIVAAGQLGNFVPYLLIALDLVMLVSLLTLLAAAVRRWTTEIAVTDRRVIFKRGLIRRHTIEMNMDKVETVDVDQSLAGRLLGYGDIVVRGTGSSIEPFRKIAAPLDFRNQVTAR
ncbi:MAG: PH domain-containing protein [Alphaproteobacteria bacterium]|nr:PH domain-containing protein [Alphaproteobacteria bacterium]MDE1931079.1 PH domain-containing protein [Alphaproteobacteria bacterium]